MRRDCVSWLAATLCLFAAGCFSYGPYGQPGPYGSVPHTAMGPQPMIGGAPPGTVWVPATPSAPGKVTLGPAAVTAPEPVRRPTSEPVDHFEEPANGKTVPDPVEPSKDDRPVVSPTGYDEETLVQPRNKKTSQRTKPQSTDDGDVARSERGSRRLSLDSDLEPPNDDESGLQTAEFQTRVRAGGVQPVSAERMSDANEEHGPEERYGYDSEGYTWLKGIAEFDRKHQTWHLIYDRSPDDADQFGGEVTFKHRPEFAKLLRSGQAIYVEGHFDEGQQDRLGKPLYDVEAYRPIDKAERSVR